MAVNLFDKIGICCCIELEKAKGRQSPQIVIVVELINYD